MKTDNGKVSSREYLQRQPTGMGQEPNSGNTQCAFG
jgi:hypothetical protein